MARDKTSAPGKVRRGRSRDEARPSSGPARPPSVAASWQRLFGRPPTICLVLALITFALFWPVHDADFVNYDDADYVTANAHVQGGLTWANTIWAFTSGHASNWHPLTWLSHMLDCQIFGQGPGAMLLVNAGFHALNTLLVFLVLRRMTGAHWRSAAVAALFAWHPLHVESVAWISERKDVLSACFLLLSLAAYVRYVEAFRRGGSNAVTFYGLCLLLFALGLMSKPMLVTLPFMLLLLDYWPLNRLGDLTAAAAEPANSPNPCFFRGGRWWLVIEKIPFLILAAASSVITFVVQQKGGAVSTSLPFGGRLANAAVSYARYLGKVFWPVNLSVLYPHPGSWPIWAVAGATLLLVMIFTLVVWQRRERPYLAVGWLWFFGGLVPVIGLIQVGIQSMADRYSYVPSIGLFIALVWAVADASRQSSRIADGMLASAAAVGLTACVVLTNHQLGFWQNSDTLFRHAVQVTPKNYLAYNNLGYFLSNRGRNREAMEFYAKSLAINPQYEDALNNMGYALAGEKNYKEAIGYYEQALKVRPNQVEVHNNLGNALSELGKIDEAIQEYQFVLREKPDHADAHNNLGIALAMQGKLEEAIVHFRAAIRFKPTYASAYSNLGNALAAQHKFEEATRQYLESLRLNPTDAQAQNNLGNVLSELGRLGEAIPRYREALRLNTDNPEAHFNLGLALLRSGQRPQAIAHLNEALRLNPDYAEARKELDRLVSDGAGMQGSPK